MLHIGTVRGNGEHLHICKNYGTKLGPQHYILQCCHGDSTVYISSHWIKSIWSLGNWDSYIVYYTTKFFHHFCHWEVIKMTTNIKWMSV
jgi:hypothetical protein